MIGVFEVFLCVSRQQPAEYHSLGDNSFPSDNLKFLSNQASNLFWLYNLALLAPFSNKSQKTNNLPFLPFHLFSKSTENRVPNYVIFCFVRVYLVFF